MKKLLKKILPPIFLDIWSFIKKTLFIDNKPTWYTVKDGPLKGMEIYVNVHNGYFAQMIEGSYDNYIYQSIKDIDLKNTVAVDVGSHIGYHSIGFSRLVGEKGKVYAIDPNPVNLERLRKISENNSTKNIKICNFGLSDRIGKSYFNFSSNVDNMTSSGGFLDGKNKPLADDTYENIGFEKKKIETKTLDSFISENSINDISIIKIDVEGHEANVLKGGLKTLKNLSPVILIEIHTIKAMYDSEFIMREIGYDSEVIHQEEDGRLFLKYYKNKF